ncbi:S1 family peptidase [Lentilitoribacter sp. EG35]|uniref:S1 family peptidase n=1 Tax=Lentilitoribacter sp. EG35 TaxID=3234192 RepID=UPI00346108CD
MIIHRLSLTSTPIRLFFNDTELAVGTGFFVNRGEEQFFVTAWHNLTGRHRWTGKCLRSDASVPNLALIGVRYYSRISYSTDQKLVDEKLLWIRVPLYGESNLPIWLVHSDPTINADVAVIPFSITGETPVDCAPIFVSPSKDEIGDMAYRVGSDIFILGYPFGVEPWPTWKRGTIASEPYLTESQQVPFLSIDTAIRQGLSGSPVYIYSSGSYENEDGITRFPKEASTCHRFLGIYTGRRPTSSSDDAQIGIVWGRKIIDMIISEGQPDCRSEDIQPKAFSVPTYNLPKPSDAGPYHPVTRKTTKVVHKDE